ncbi:MAG: superoxide dismutase [Hyphomicrobium sp.]|nr:superoxide dismutase [Hyphomicrobium sp.]
MNRRDLIRTLAATALISATARYSSAAVAEDAGEAVFKLPPLGYGYEALEPHIDTATMTVHHSGHHQAFITNLNKLVGKVSELKTKPIVEILTSLDGIATESRTAVRNNLGGHFNHTFFWDVMTPGGAKAPAGDLAQAIDGTFGSKDKMIDEVTKAAMGRFGSGWAWLAVGKDKKLTVFSTANQDTPHMELAAKPVIGVDVWEHAYYLKHKNKRADYLTAWWNTVNWDKAAANFKSAAG